MVASGTGVARLRVIPIECASKARRGEVEDQEDRTRRDDGSEPVHEHRPESPGPGRTTAQYVIIALGALILVAALLWMLLPFGAS